MFDIGHEVDVLVDAPIAVVIRAVARFSRGNASVEPRHPAVDRLSPVGSIDPTEVWLEQLGRHEFVLAPSPRARLHR
jgi:hypothetical protein